MKLADSRSWNDLADIADVRVLDSNDEDCLAEVQRVIEAHGLTRKFGVTLLHKHFEIGDDEVMLERVNAPEKRLVTEPVKAHDIDQSKAVTTTWRFDRGTRYVCKYCVGNTSHH